MEFIDLKARYRRTEPRIRARLDAVLEHGRFIMGPEVAELEAELARFSGAKHCVSCSSGTDALLMALMAWGVGPGDAVFLPAFSFFATGEAPALLGATPVLVDIDPATFNMDASALEKAVEAVAKRDPSIYPLPAPARERTLKPRAVIPVDLFGQSADYDALLAVADKHDLSVLEDAAQSFGAEYRGRKTCALGCHIAATSFFPAKPLGCFGDGGAAFTESDETAETLRSIRAHGKGDDKYDNVRIGLNGRLDTLQAAILLANLEVFPEEVEARQRVAARYAENLSNMEGIVAPAARADRRSVWAQYTARVTGGRRDAVAAGMKARGVPTNIYYPTPMHLLAAFAHLGYAPEDMPKAHAASGEVLSLPFHPYMTEDEVGIVAAALRGAVKEAGR
ncbi:MAG: DegT/DnrJ/EryC1/StrS family aminotransferase [Desulfovibrio sp.]|jgi:dTDP-4-amino-4,6-dideoxygalactose transaminase|nr:DegT/DnrJ/EryC1/StrS family aminotransferase [Desulfovibrio sp.]